MVGQVKRDAGNGRPTDGSVAPTPGDSDVGGGGVVTVRKAAPGSTVRAGSPLAQLYGINAGTDKAPPRAAQVPVFTDEAPTETVEAPEFTEKAPVFTDAPPTPPRPPLLQPPQPRPPQSPRLGAPPGVGVPTTSSGGVTATVSALEPKGLRARIRAVKPRNLAIIGAAAAAVVVAIVVASVLLVGQGPEDERLAEFAFDSDTIHSITDGMSVTVAPGDTNSGGDPNSLWNYETAPTPGGTSPSGTSKYTPPYRGSSRSNFIPYTPPEGSGSGDGGDGGGGDQSGAPAAVMAAGSYAYGGSGSLPVAFWGKVVPVPQSVSGSVRTADGCSTLDIGAAGVTVSSKYCLSGGAITTGVRSRALQNNGRLTLTCPGTLVPVGARGGQLSEVSCTAAAGGLSEPMLGDVVLSDGGSAWVATTSVSAANGDAWTEHVTIDKASGKVLALKSTVQIAFPAYQESTAFTLQ